jgi:hypothetical protein
VVRPLESDKARQLLLVGQVDDIEVVRSHEPFDAGRLLRGLAASYHVCQQMSTECPKDLHGSLRPLREERTDPSPSVIMVIGCKIETSREKPKRERRTEDRRITPALSGSP